jgi:hypothetical protein
MVKVLEVAVTAAFVATIMTVPIGLLGTVWTVVEAPFVSVVAELSSRVVVPSAVCSASDTFELAGKPLSTTVILSPTV